MKDWRRRLDQPHNLRQRDLLRAAIVCGVMAFVFLFLSVAYGHCQERSDRSRFVWTASTYAGLSAIDAVQTTRAISGGSAREANPVMRPVVSSPEKLALVKGASTAAILGASLALRQRHPHAAWVLLLSTTAVQAAAVGWNWRQLSKAGR